MLIKEISISYSKNVVTPRKEKAEGICPYMNCSICSVDVFTELPCKYTKYLIKSQVI